MIGKLTGKIVSIEVDRIILDVNDVGYLIFVSGATIGRLNVGDSVSLIIETYVREELINLYGFTSAEEKSAFNMLTTVSGVGPKAALTILTHLSSEQLVSAIVRKDIETFRSVSGIGPKIAERIVLELKNKVGNISLGTENHSEKNNYNGVSTTLVNDALSALMNLGINRSEAYNAIQKTIQNNPKISLNELIRIALQVRGTI